MAVGSVLAVCARVYVVFRCEGIWPLACGFCWLFSFGGGGGSIFFIEEVAGVLFGRRWAVKIAF